MVCLFISCCFSLFSCLIYKYFLFRKLVFPLLNNNNGADNCLVVDKKTLRVLVLHVFNLIPLKCSKLAAET